MNSIWRNECKKRNMTKYVQKIQLRKLWFLVIFLIILPSSGEPTFTAMLKLLEISDSSALLQDRLFECHRAECILWNVNIDVYVHYFEKDLEETSSQKYDLKYFYHSLLSASRYYSKKKKKRIWFVLVRSAKEAWLQAFCVNPLQNFLSMRDFSPSDLEVALNLRFDSNSLQKRQKRK